MSYFDRYYDMEHEKVSINYALSQTIILCYEVFERNNIETKAAHFFKKVRWLG